MDKYQESKNNYAKEKVDALRVYVPKGRKTEIQQFAKSSGYRSLNSFIVDLIEREMNNTNKSNVSKDTFIGGDNNGIQAIKNGSVTINQGQKETDQENQELLALIQSLPLKKRAKIITMIYDIAEEEL